MIMNNNYLSKNIIKDLVRREIDSDYNEIFRRSYVYTKDSIDRLNQKCELKGHEGCVNCIEWNDSGTMMASGSDDRKLMFWDPFQQKRIASLDTKHEGNIFGVKFLPFSNDNIIASCAADCAIYVHDLNRQQTINDLKTHRKRVKRLATAPDEPHLFWSSGEDGYILQHDLRCNTNEISSVLVSYSSCPYYASLSANNTCSMYHHENEDKLEAKCLAINPMRTEYMAVGCNDPYARVYDRRMIPTQRHFLQSPASTSRSSNRTKCVHEYITNDSNEMIKYYVPGHIPSRIKDNKYRYLSQISITYLTYNLDGTELLVNISGEQVYLFDVNKPTHPTYKYNTYLSMFADVDLTTNAAAQQSGDTHDGKKNGYSKQSSTESDGGKKEKEQKYPAHIESLKKLANDCFESQDYYEAIEYYNKAIELAPQWSILYGNRAAALMKRRWNGDAYAALQDCYHALSLDKKYLKSHFRLSKCLHELKWYKEAEECLNLFCSMYPDYANSQACENLVEEIKKSIEKQNNSKAKRSASSSSSSSTNQSRYSNVKKERRDTTAQEQSVPDSDDNEDSESDTDNHGAKTSSNQKLEKLCCKHDLKIQNNAIDFKKRYVGHCNVSTDIKEASFVGEDFIAAGSDDGSFYVWNKHNTNLVRVFKADESIVNCIQANPHTCTIATSGIDNTIKIWSPGGDFDERVVKDVKPLITTNQKKMNQNPFDLLLMNLEQGDDLSQRNFCRTS